MAANPGEIPTAVLERLRTICTALPGAVEEEAWAGIRWTIRRKNLAHVVAIAEDYLRRRG